MAECSPTSRGLGFKRHPFKRRFDVAKIWPVGAAVHGRRRIRRPHPGDADVSKTGEFRKDLGGDGKYGHAERDGSWVASLVMSRPSKTDGAEVGGKISRDQGPIKFKLKKVVLPGAVDR